MRFVGHTLADAIPLEADRAAARAELGLPDGPLVALDARQSWWRSRPVSVRCSSIRPNACEPCAPVCAFVAPCANPERRAQLEELLAGRDLPLTLLDG